MIKNKYVSYNGILQIKDSNLINQYNEIFTLKGISFHGIQWYGNLCNKSMIKSIKEKFNINAFRIAMYTEEDGYIYNKSLKTKAKELITICIELDLYVIIDWHILNDNNPLIYKNEAKIFFEEISKEYSKTPNLIYEICNEPNGNTDWKKDIKPYAEELIKMIRKNSPYSIIIVGTETYSQRIDIAADNPLKFNNIMYSLHFYSGTHKKELRDKFIYAKNKGLPIIVSEFGLSDAETNTKVDLKEAEIWLRLLKENNISIFNWSLSNKNEASSLLKEKCSQTKINEKDLTISGKFILEQYKNY